MLHAPRAAILARESERGTTNRDATTEAAAPSVAKASAAPVAPAGVADGVRPLALFTRLWIRERRPVCCRWLGLRPRVPGRDAAVHIARAMNPVWLGGEVVDDGGFHGVPALLRAFDLAILAAAFAEEVAFGPLAVRAAATPALRNGMGTQLHLVSAMRSSAFG